MKRLLLTALIALSSPAFAQESSLPACDKRNGYFNNCHASYAWADGRKYIGEWKDDKRNGKGTMTWADGDKYYGEFKDGYRHGQGTYTFANGAKYAGEWKDGKRNGTGINTDITGQSVTEVWEMGSYIGIKAELDEQERARKAEVARKVQARKEAEVAGKMQAKKEAEDKFKKIYNACLLDKSSKIDMQVMALKEALEATCEAIAKNPSWYEELKYN
jgi:hypothetical protein